jgi:AraC-like DNA-binding protein
MRYAERRGLSRTEVAARFGVDLAVLEDPDGRVPLATLTRMWDELPALTADPDMPLHVLEHAAASDPPLTMLLFLSSPTLGEAYRRMERYQRLTHDLADSNASVFEVDGSVAHVVLYHERSPILPPTGAVIDAFLGLLLLSRLGTERDVTPLAIRLRHPRPANLEKYREALRCPVEFGAPRDRMTLRASDLELALPNASRTLRAIVERHANSLLETLPREQDLVTAVRKAVRERMPNGDVTVADVSQPLAMSPRTLQRRLEEAGTSLRNVVDEERHRLALEYIRDRKTSMTDIAFLLGFSDLSAFTRAFTRWTAVAPTEYRRRSG